jgi:hypothetical protein
VIDEAALGPEPLSARRANAERLRRETLVARVHQIAGVRGLFEVLDELVRDGVVSHSALDSRLSRFASLDQKAVKAIGADRMPPRPVHIIGGA